MSDPWNLPTQDPETIRERLDKAQADADRYAALAEDYRRKAREAREPYEARIQDLIEEADKAAADFEYEADGAKKKLKEARETEIGLRHNLQLTVDGPPEREDFCEWYAALRAVHTRGTLDGVYLPNLYKGRALKTSPRVDGYTILSAKDPYDSAKVYAAWDEAGDLRAIMVVYPSQHAGDGTDADLLVDGRKAPTSLLWDVTWDVKNPVSKFKDALARLRDHGAGGE